MSGGSFDYLCWKDDDAVSIPLLHDMAQALRVRGMVEAAEETENLIRAREIRQPLRDLWHAMEWFTSGDTSEKQLLASYVEYLATDKPV